MKTAVSVVFRVVDVTSRVAEAGLGGCGKVGARWNRTNAAQFVSGRANHCTTATLNPLCLTNNRVCIEPMVRFWVGLPQWHDQRTSRIMGSPFDSF